MGDWVEDKGFLGWGLVIWDDWVPWVKGNTICNLYISTSSEGQRAGIRSRKVNRGQEAKRNSSHRHPFLYNMLRF